MAKLLIDSLFVWPLKVLTEQGHQALTTLIRQTDRAPVVKCSFLLITFSCANKISPTHLSCPNSSTHKWAVFHKTQTLKAVAKCWGLPLSLLPKLPNCFQRWPAIQASHARIQTHTQAQFHSKWSQQTHGHLEEKEKKKRSLQPQISFCWCDGNERHHVGIRGHSSPVRLHQFKWSVF